eukprot:GEZU01036571.1.p1 GENE.GEZU01036571.1~~GEZU01036571.1.p1  ORF type:complete len:1205 (-),score=317.64 GEZU01036571.1:47-3661(-)
MLTKFETRSNRVKGLSFHPKRPWVLASLHNGVIQLWDYRMGTLLDKYEEHEGPVRGIDFHHSQPLFVSGGDDYKIKVWNYKLKRCLFTLSGHLDYIRTVQFHHEQPWIVSASDDQTIRIWNWQSRSCVSVLTGHNHYVMCASFHPKDDLIVSASLDQTVRVWDISALKSKGRYGAGNIQEQLGGINQDLFGNNDAMVKFILEGHDRGVNWASFHPTLPLIVSGADDRTVKLWRMNEIRAWEVETLRGHVNNVSCVMFHPKQDLVISNSEDKSIRVWDLTKRTALHAYRREHDRFWILAMHPEQNLIAAGHDNGLMVFKFERERPASIVYKDSVLYVKDKFIRKYDFDTNSDSPLIPLRAKGNGHSPPPRFVSYNAQEGYILVQSDHEGGTWELYQVSKNASSGPAKQGPGSAAVFVGRNKFAVLDKGGQILVKNLDGEVTKKISFSESADLIFQAVTGRVLLRTVDKVHLFDLQQSKILASITTTSNVRYVVWSPDMTRVALLSKHTIIIANSMLEQLCSIHETIRVKSGAFDENGIFIYTTFNHMKYCLPNGDNGVIKTLDKLLYIVRVKSNAIHFLDRSGNVTLTYIDATEYKFKMALLQKRYDEIQQIANKSVILGQSIIAYLQQKGYPEVAMKFVKDDATRFELALECGNIQTAIEAATKLDKKEYWQRLGVEALRQGNHQVVEKAYQSTKDFERLSFLYLITGNHEKLKKMLKIAEIRKDNMSRFHNALYLGDVATRVKVLEEVGQYNLAYITAATHGLTQEAEALKAKLEAAGSVVPDVNPNSKLLHPPTPILREANWPLLNVQGGPLDRLNEQPQGKFTDVTAPEQVEVSAWEDEDQLPEEEEAKPAKQAAPQEEGGGWDLDDSDMADMQPAETAATSTFFVAPMKGQSLEEIWCANSQLAADHIAAGSFETAMGILNRTAGIINFEPLKPLFMSVYMGASASTPMSLLLPPTSLPLQRNYMEAGEKRSTSLPALAISLAALEKEVKVAYKATTEGRFNDARTSFMSILHSLLLVAVSTKDEVDEIKELLGICREYITAMVLELQRKEIKDANPARSTELAAYFTHCSIQPIHLMLSLGSAMNVAYRAENFGHAAGFARRLLDLNPNESMATKARNYLSKCEKNPTNKHKINYDERNPFVICGHSLTPIYRGSSMERCSYCFAPYQPQYKGRLCNICQVAEIGGTHVGLLSSISQYK